MASRILLAGAGLILGTTALSAAETTHFVPLAPCRIVDTRAAPIPPQPGFTNRLQRGETREFAVRGETRDFSFQGGSRAGCGVPDEAVAASLNFIAVQPSGPGHLVAWGDDPMPLASVLSYSSGINVANEVPLLLQGQIVCISPPCDQPGFHARAATSDIDLVVDVYGYYLPTPP